MANPSFQGQVTQTLVDISQLSQYFDSQLYIQIISIVIAVFVSSVVTYFVAKIKQTGKLNAISLKIDQLADEQKKLSAASKAGEIDAISENIRAVVTQLEITTETAERIKKNIEHDHWRKRELEQVRRQKLEDVFSLVSNSLNEAFRLYADVLMEPKEDISYEEYSTSLDTAVILIDLYFIELRECSNQFFEQFHKFSHFVHESRKKIESKISNNMSNIFQEMTLVQIQSCFVTEREVWLKDAYSQQVEELVSCQQVLIEAIRQLANDTNKANP